LEYAFCIKYASLLLLCSVYTVVGIPAVNVLLLASLHAGFPAANGISSIADPQRNELVQHFRL
jgi:hypothetical protein